MSPRVALHLQVGRRSVTVCRFNRYPIVENVNGRRKIVGRGDWRVTHKFVRVRTVEPEAPGIRESFNDPMTAARAKNAPMVVLRTDTRFEFWDVAQQRISFAVTHDKLAAVLDAFAAAGQGSIELAALRAALQERSC